MRKYITFVAILAVAFLCIGISSSVFAACSDGDGGKIYTQKETVVYNGISYTDKCYNAIWLLEYYCENGVGKSVYYDKCSGGCQDGKCKTPQESCKPTYKADGSEKGVSYTSPTGVVSDYNDVCTSNGAMVDFYCENNKYAQKDVTCANGCYDGACRQESCKVTYKADGSEKGVSYTSPTGVVSDYNDYCTSSGAMVDFYCQNNKYAQKDVSCPNGCLDGMCKVSTTPPVNCANLANKVTSSINMYGVVSCGNANYKSVNDVNGDKSVTASDVLATYSMTDAQCVTQLSSPKDVCTPADGEGTIKCWVKDVYSQIVSGSFDQYNIFVKVQDLPVSAETNYEVSGTETWNSYGFVKEGTLNGITTLRSTRGLSNSQVSFVVSTKNTVTLLDSTLKVVCNSINSLTNLPPKVSEIAGPINLTVGQVASFSVNPQDPEGKKMTYSVNWGDGMTASGGETTGSTVKMDHIYNLAGKFTIDFSLKDDVGQLATSSLGLSVVNSTSDNHKVCNTSKQCIVVSGAGINECSTDSDCGIVTPPVNCANLANKVTSSINMYGVVSCGNANYKSVNDVNGDKSVTASDVLATYSMTDAQCVTQLSSPKDVCTCIPNWTIGVWSACSGGIQTRNVVDANNCLVTIGKPASSGNCTANCTYNNKGITYRARAYNNYCSSSSWYVGYYCEAGVGKTRANFCKKGVLSEGCDFVTGFCKLPIVSILGSSENLAENVGQDTLSFLQSQVASLADAIAKLLSQLGR